jgi:hypothetical protein
MWNKTKKLPCVAHLRMSACIAALLLIGAAPADQATDFVRRGNGAFQQDDLDTALEFYDQAEERITDPGLVAYNQAVTLYRQGRWREAELRFRCSVEGADAVRKTRSYYGLGNALVMQGGDEDVIALQAAVEAYRLCRKQPGLSPEMLHKTNHNLEVARLLLLQAKAKAANRPPKPEDGSNQTQEQKNAAKKYGPENNNTGDPNNQANSEPGNKEKSQGGKEKPGQTDQTTPGAGRLPTLPDEDKLVPLSSEDAQLYLQEAVRRIEQQRRQDWQSRQPAAKNVKDW